MGKRRRESSDGAPAEVAAGEPDDAKAQAKALRKLEKASRRKARRARKGLSEASGSGAAAGEERKDDEDAAGPPVKKIKKAKKANEATEAKASTDKPKAKKSPKFFNGKVFSCTAKGDEGGGDGDGDGDGQQTYSQVKEQVMAAGGKVSSMLHKRVFALIATERATARRTQRVRKALKHNIPIVSTDFVVQSHAAKRCLDVADFALDVEPETEAEAAGRMSRAVGQQLLRLIVKQNEPEPIKVDLGCCCSCHDDGKPSCSWCEPHH